MSGIRKKVAIVGIGETALGKWPEKNSLQLYTQAVKSALDDAGLAKDDIDGVLTANSFVDPHPMHSVVFSEYMGISPKYSATLILGGATGCAMAEHAACAIAAGICDTVVVAHGDNRLSGLTGNKAVEMLANFGSAEFEQPYGILIPAIYALIARRHMFEYGTTSEQLAAVAVAIRKHASLNPNAHMRNLITIDDVLKSKMVSDPLHVLDCAIISDGGAALVLTSAERAKDLRNKPVYLLGAGEYHLPEQVSEQISLTESGCKISGERAFKMAGITPKDVNVAELYDCFSISVILQLEGLGFVKKGEGGGFAAEGRIELNGDLPVTTHGGLLSCGQPGPSGGMLHIIEAVRQLRGEAGERQVKNAQIALVHGMGGFSSSHCTLLLGRE